MTTFVIFDHANNQQQVGISVDKDDTGWSISILYTLYCSYDKNNICTKKIVVGICSVHRDISSKTNNLFF